jgi:hippurate hydrolase
MAIINRIADFHADMTAWRRQLHAHPETAFEEHETASFVAARLAELGLPTDRGLAKTGVVATIAGNRPGPAIALRADMDALHIHERNGFAHASTEPGKMHACGHDGHTAMLLGAARYLAETRNFAGTVHVVFQPAEENEGGGRAMVEEGLFRRFPVDAVYGMHNWPGLPVGEFAVRPGAMLAACDLFEIVVEGTGAHAALPHLGIDPIICAAQIATALQTVTSRNTHPLESAVLSITQFHGGDTWNVIPDRVVLRGTARSFKPELSGRIEAALRRIATGTAAAMGARVEITYDRRYPATVNSAAETEVAIAAASAVVGPSHVDRNVQPTMGSEDFAFMLNEKPGCYIFIGNGVGERSAGLHNPHYDFNDEILPIGASYWARLVEQVLGRG